MTSATTPRNSIAAVLFAEVRLNFCERRPSPPTKNERPSTSSRLPTMLPVIEALTSSTWPLRSATTAMMSSAALPKVALRNPPQPGPDRRASCSVPRPISPASGTSAAAAVMNTQGEAGTVAASTQETGAATSRTLMGDAKMARIIDRRVPSIPELFDVFVVGAGQQIEEGVQAAIERAAKLGNRAVEGVQRQPGARAVGELQRAFVDALERS